MACLLAAALLLAPTPGSSQPGVPHHEADSTVYFSPGGGATAAIVEALGLAKASVRVEPYTFTSARIAKALLGAHNRGVPKAAAQASR